jgi:hypothetical protein
LTIDGVRREITKREAVATQLVNKSTGADLRATKMLIDMLKDAEKKAGVAPPPEPAPFTAADEEVMATFIARLRQSWDEELQQKGTEPGPYSKMTSAGNFTWTRYDTLLRLDFVSFAQRCFRELCPRTAFAMNGIWSSSARNWRRCAPARPGG